MKHGLSLLPPFLCFVRVQRVRSSRVHVEKRKQSQKWQTQKNTPKPLNPIFFQFIYCYDNERTTTCITWLRRCWLFVVVGLGKVLGKFLGPTNGFGFIFFPNFRHIVIQGIIWIRSTQQGLDRQQHGTDL